MQAYLASLNRHMDLPIDALPRLMVLAAAVLLLLTYLFPLWSMTMFAPQYPDGLRLYIYGYKLDGGNGGQDVKEVNVLNHYIGMKELTSASFTEFKWIPFVLGALGLLFLRAAVMGKVRYLVDILALYLYFSLFSLWSFGYKLYAYGHALDPKASVKVPPFMPPMFGYKKLANFEVYSYPAPASYALGAVALILIAALLIAWMRRPDARAAGPGP
jgi:hypothetical protein